MLGLIRNLILSTAIVAIAGCPGDPTEASSSVGSVGAESTGSVDDSNTVSADDDSVSVSISDTSAEDTSDPTGDPDTGNDPECGNGVVEPPETCDLGPNNTMGATCTDECQDNVCNDGYVGYGESCEPPGVRGCGDDCILTSCGDNIVDPDVGEECDPPQQDVCSATCTLPGCGDGMIQPGLGEECEGADLGGQTCASIGHVSGDLQCDVACQFVETSCSDCGNGSVQGSEQCDGGIGAATCVTQGFDEGTLMCSASCMFDTSGCINAVCGNNNAEGEEICDGTDLNNHTCQSEGFAPGGVISCTNCALVTTGCSLCGNGALDDGEDCDGAIVPITMCNGLGLDYDQGTVTCTNCEYNVSQCCGDDVGDECSGNASCCGPNFDCGGSGCCIANGSSCQGSSANCCSGSCTMGGNGSCT